MMRLSNTIAEARLAPDAANVLILAPFVVPIKVQFVTRTPLTSISFGNLPRLPTLLLKKRVWKSFSNIYEYVRIYFYVVRLLPNKYLIPCPGPQVTCLIDTFIAPWPIEMQSSPVAMLVLPMLTV